MPSGNNKHDLNKITSVFQKTTSLILSLRNWKKYNGEIGHKTPLVAFDQTHRLILDLPGTITILGTFAQTHRQSKNRKLTFCMCRITILWTDISMCSIWYMPAFLIHDFVDCYGSNWGKMLTNFVMKQMTEIGTYVLTFRANIFIRENKNYSKQPSHAKKKSWEGKKVNFPFLDGRCVSANVPRIVMVLGKSTIEQCVWAKAAE